MTENLDVFTFVNGDSIKESKNSQQWFLASENHQPAWCYYNFNKKDGEKYGKLYNWYAVNDSRGISPEGWRIPSSNDWEVLITFLGGKDVAGKKLKASTGWLKEGNGTNESQFNMRSGTSCTGNGGFTKPNKYSEFWTSTQFSTNNSFYVATEYKNDKITVIDCDKSWGYSIRCIKN